jgi:hypothetical protein
MGKVAFERYRSVPVLGYSKSGKIQVVTYEHTEPDNPKQWYSNCSNPWVLGQSVTHWMPLPEPPKTNI